MSKPSSQIRAAMVAGAGVVVLLVVLLLVLGGEDDTGGNSTSSPETAASSKAALVSESELLGAMEGVGYPVYWAGPRIGVGYEVQRPVDGRTYVRYLPKGEEIESEKPFLTVGSYRREGALEAIRELAASGGILVKFAGGGSVYAESAQSTSAYLAFPGVDTQVEVYDPQPGAALDLARSGAIVPVG